MPKSISTMTDFRRVAPERFTSNIRVFLSSTFRDMQAERAMLLAQAFPPVRQLCARAGLGFHEVDLRWGVTAQEAEAGEVLRICLDEIDACRPYFLATIGGRYGWIDPDAERRLSASFPHLARYADRSVTELEIRHALLDRPDGAQNCTPLVYVREDAVAASADEPSIRRLLADLAATGIPLRPYVTPDDLAAQVSADLAAAIAPVLEAAPDRSTAVDQRAFEAMLLATGFQRDLLVDQLRGKLLRNRKIVVVGPSGCGKSTLLAALARIERVRRSAPDRQSRNLGLLARIGSLFSRGTDDGPVLFASLAAMSGSWQRLSLELCGTAGIEATADPVADFDRLLSEFKGTVVIDDLDAGQDLIFGQAQAWLRNADWQAKLVVSTSDRALADNLAAQNFALFEMPRVAPVDRSAMMESILITFGKRLDEKQQEMVHGAAVESPALLRIICEEMRHLGLFEEVDSTLRELLSLENESRAFEVILARLESGNDRAEMVSRTLLLLSAARSGLTERELQDILGVAGKPLPMMRLSAILLPLRPYLLDRRGVLSIAYPSLEAAVGARYRRGRDASHERSELISHFLSNRLTPRSIDELPWLIAMNRDAAAAQTLAGDMSFLAAAMERDSVACRAFLRSLPRLSLAAANSAAARAVAAVADVASGDEMIAVALQAATALGAAVEAVSMAMSRASGSQSAALLDALADGLTASGRSAEALSVLQRLRRQFDGANDAARIASVTERAGAVAQQTGDAELARALFMEAASAHQSHGNRWAASRARASVGTALIDLGRYREADELFAEVEIEARRRHDYDVTSLAIGGRGIAQRFAGRPRKAIELLKEEARRWRLSGNGSRLANSMINQAQCAIDLDDFDGADALLEMAIAEARSGRDERMELAALDLRVEILQRLGLDKGARFRKLAAERDALKAASETR
ncbi:DUF4062 domain-containing protein [Mesorhizobium sp. KR9-304]|uniref:DUF4062 domain-containing protein n=1 Tax=Mesorhizobium sp. KR9-304 TaxID=3156614 RepID=UPI0032B47CA0